jgi:perosamine synthetase
MFQETIQFIKSTYGSNEFIPLHVPKFIGNEKAYVNECLDSSYVSSVGKFVSEFENKIAKYTNSKYAIATSSGTSAMHISLLLAGVRPQDEVLTQALTFVATCNSINYCGANPIFIDVDKDTMGMSPEALAIFLEENAIIENDSCINKQTRKNIRACVPMHTFGHPCRISEIKKICDHYKILLIEDAAESLGSLFEEKHTGTFGKIGIISFNGNKIATAGGGGCIITDNPELAKSAKHLTTTAKVPHAWHYNHDKVGYNYRMPNINAALVLGQIESIDKIIVNKRELSSKYKDFFESQNIKFHIEPDDAKSNYWLNAVILNSKSSRDIFLSETNKNNIMTRPIWTLMSKLKMYKNSQSDNLKNSLWLEERVVNIPSSPVI